MLDYKSKEKTVTHGYKAMSKNPNPSPETRFKPQWERGKTKTIRVPVILADNILEYARTLDKKEIPNNLVTRYCELIQELENIAEKIEQKEKGYQNNNASKLIKKLHSIIK